MLQQRLQNQAIAGTRFTTPGEVVSWLGAVQAQDYLGSLWAIGLRMQHATEAMVEEAVAARTIVRTWPMRGTLHFVAAADVRWMLALLTPRIVARSAGRYRQLELEDADIARSREVCISVLRDGKQLTRPALYQRLDEAGISTAGQRGLHIAGRLAHEGLLCFGSREGKQHTFTLLDEWLPPARPLERDEALAELTRRYFTGHGPATVQDLMWWSGLTTAEVNEGLAPVRSQLASEEIDGKVYWFSPHVPHTQDDALRVDLLPAFDEYLVGYKDRSAALGVYDWQLVNRGNNGMLNPTIAINGQVAGTWKRTIKGNSVVVTPVPFTPLRVDESESLKQIVQRYGRFLGLTASVQE